MHESDVQLGRLHHHPETSWKGVLPAPQGAEVPWLLLLGQRAQDLPLVLLPTRSNQQTRDLPRPGRLGLPSTERVHRDLPDPRDRLADPADHE